MDWLKEKEISLWKQEGFEIGIGASILIRKGDLASLSIAEEQQLQIQKGEQESSPQPLEC